MDMLICNVVWFGFCVRVDVLDSLPLRALNRGLVQRRAFLYMMRFDLCPRDFCPRVEVLGFSLHALIWPVCSVSRYVCLHFLRELSAQYSFFWFRGLPGTKNLDWLGEFENEN